MFYLVVILCGMLTISVFNARYTSDSYLYTLLTPIILTISVVIIDGIIALIIRRLPQKYKSITDKEIVIVDGKPMWKDDYKKIAKKEKNAKFIAFYTLTNNYSKDITLTIVKVTKNPTDGIYHFNDCSQYDEVSLLRKEYFSHYDYNRSDCGANNSDAIHLYGCDDFWDDLNEENAENYVIYNKDYKGIIDVEKTIQNINNSFNTDMEIIESWSTIDFHRNFCYKFCDKEQLDYYLEVEILGELTTDLYYDVETYLSHLSDKNKNSKIKDLETYKLIKV